MPVKVLTIVGARPQFIKAAAVSRAIRIRQDEIAEVIVHTGQHFDAEMSDVFFRELDIAQPAYNLDIHGGDHGQMTGRMLEAVEKVVKAERPNWILVYGDTNSTLAGALAAAKLQIPIAHVEAGLRSFNRTMPEEINRVLCDHVSTLLFCPTTTAVKNLANEGIISGVMPVGDVMFDATLTAVAQARRQSAILSTLGLHPGGFSVATVHRAENTSTRENLAVVLDFLRSRAVKRPVVLPVHPRTRQAVIEFGLTFDGLQTCPPVGYLDMASLLDNCFEVLTDSGGLQKEAYFHHKPCITMRNETEWVETVDCGWNRLWTMKDYVSPRCDIADYGDGKASERIAQALTERRV